MMVTWFSDGQPSYNTMVDIDTNMFNNVSTLFTTAGYGKKNKKNKLITFTDISIDFYPIFLLKSP